MGPTRRRLSRLCCTAMVGLIAAPLIVVASTTPAAADTWPFNRYFRPDKGKVSYCWSAGPSAPVKKQMYNAMVYMTNSTQANRAYQSRCDFSGTGQTDVVWREEGTPSDSWIGSAQCVVLSTRPSPDQCDRYIVRINGRLVRAQYSRAADRARQFRKTSCHELGHTLGLNHYPAPYNKSCQRSGLTGTNGSAWTRTWTAHHRGHINAWF